MNYEIPEPPAIMVTCEEHQNIAKLAFQSRLLESTCQAIIAMDEKHVINYWNDGAAKIFGVSAQEAIGQTADEVMFAGYAEPEFEEMRNRLAAEEGWSTELQVKRLDGSVLTVAVNRDPVRNDAGEVVGSVCVVTDISDQKALELELAEYVDALGQTIEKIRELNEKLLVVGSLTRHDIRNKLAAVNGYLYLLKKRFKENQDALSLIAEVENASKQVLDILEFERIYEQVGSEEQTFVDVGKILSEAATLVTDFKGVKLKCECNGVEVLADSLLRQVLYNLIDNTLKYGEKTTAIRLYSQQSGDQLLLVFEDDGVGIPEDERKRLFEKGFGKGTGFGLYLSKRLLDAYGWTMEEQGQFRVGAKFVITVPAGRFRTKSAERSAPK